MSHKLLFPHKFKTIGWCIFIPAIILGLWVIVYGAEPAWLNAKVFTLFPSQVFGSRSSLVQVNLINTIVGVMFIIGGLFVGFSKEKQEDEFIAKIRLSSLQWAVFVNYFLLLIAFLVVYDFSFLTIMVYNMFTVLVIFIVRFNYILYKTNHFLSDEK